MPEAVVVHTVPPEGTGFTPCCNRTLFEIPRDDRITEDPTQATCAGSEYSGRVRSKNVLAKQIKARLKADPDGPATA